MKQAWLTCITQQQQHLVLSTTLSLQQRQLTCRLTAVLLLLSQQVGLTNRMQAWTEHSQMRAQGKPWVLLPK